MVIYPVSEPIPRKANLIRPFKPIYYPENATPAQISKINDSVGNFNIMLLSWISYKYRNLEIPPSYPAYFAGQNYTPEEKEQMTHILNKLQNWDNLPKDVKEGVWSWCIYMALTPQGQYIVAETPAMGLNLNLLEIFDNAFRDPKTYAFNENGAYYLKYDMLYSERNNAKVRAKARADAMKRTTAEAIIEEARRNSETIKTT